MDVVFLCYAVNSQAQILKHAKNTQQRTTLVTTTTKTTSTATTTTTTITTLVLLSNSLTHLPIVYK